MAENETLKRTALYDLHRELGGKLVPFAGYEMPVQYPAGILAEHNHTRAAAGLFDVSHMGQVRLTGDDIAAALESLVPGDIAGLEPGQMRYSFFTGAAGGILDDLMITRRDDDFLVIVNAACKEADIAHMRAGLKGIGVEYLADRALLALQGPAAAAVLARLSGPLDGRLFMTAGRLTVDGIDCYASRSGYTGEDGFELSVAGDQADSLARRLLAEPEVAPIGLGARDSLRLEAGLCLYGNDIDTTTTPVEAALLWAISKRRRTEGGFPGADTIQQQIAQGVTRRRVGLLPEGRAPARAHTEIVDEDGTKVGEITSGGFGPSVGGPVSMGYVASALAKPDTALGLMVRGSHRPARVVRMPFFSQRYYRGPGA